MFKKISSLAIIICFFFTTVGPLPKAQADTVSGLPSPGTMVNLSPEYVPLLIKGITIHPNNPFQFDFIMDTGDSGLTDKDSKTKEESQKAIKYFLAALTVPEKDLWVNLSPYEKDRMIPGNLGKTDMGRDLLMQDYILKQLTASLIYPEKQLGKIFWDKVYAKAHQMYGNAQVPVNTFNKVWIVADKADVFERNNTAFVVGAHLKVMLEQDYLSLSKHAGITTVHNQGKETGSIGSQIVREVILPEIENEVNKGQNFAPLRQMFYSMILASWFKKALKDSIIAQVYDNKSKVGVGINGQDKSINEKIYQRYLQAYKKGVFNYIKDDVNKATNNDIPRKYFSGGVNPWEQLNGATVQKGAPRSSAMLAKFIPKGQFLVVGAAFLVAVGSAVLTFPQLRNVISGTNNYNKNGQQLTELSLLLLDEATKGGHVPQSVVAGKLDTLRKLLIQRNEDLLGQLGYNPNKDEFTPKAELGLQTAQRLIAGTSNNYSPADTQTIAELIGYFKNQIKPNSPNKTISTYELEVLLQTYQFITTTFPAPVDTPTNPGGIDLEGSQMQMNIDRASTAIRIKIDPVMVQFLNQEGFKGFKPLITGIVRMKSVLPTLGLAHSH